MITLQPAGLVPQICMDMGGFLACIELSPNISRPLLITLEITGLSPDSLMLGATEIKSDVSVFFKARSVYQIPSGNFELQEGCEDVLMATEQEMYNIEFESDVGGSLILEDDECLPIVTASDGVPPGAEFMGSRKCAICGHLFKYKDLVFFRGAYYGIPCGDHNDIKGILSREADARHLGSIRDEQRRQ